MSKALTLPGWRAKLQELTEGAQYKKAARIAHHVVRAAKKFLLGSGNAAWVIGTSMLIVVMPLAFEIEREQMGGADYAMDPAMAPK